MSLLIGGTALAWLATVFPAVFWWGDSALLFSATASLICLVPAVLTHVWSHWAFKNSPESQLLALLGGTAVRMVFVIAVGMALFFLVPDFQYTRFWLWIVGFYLVVLCLEVILVTRRAQAPLPGQ